MVFPSSLLKALKRKEYEENKLMGKKKKKKWNSLGFRNTSPQLQLLVSFKWGLMVTGGSNILFPPKTDFFFLIYSHSICNYLSS